MALPSYFVYHSAFYPDFYFYVLSVYKVLAYKPRFRLPGKSFHIEVSTNAIRTASRFVGSCHIIIVCIPILTILTNCFPFSGPIFGLTRKVLRNRETSLYLYSSIHSSCCYQMVNSHCNITIEFTDSTSND